MYKHTNSLIHESSPYLLQHAHNPVQWFPWNTEALEKAKKENKLILISIGYSACHWCHVMEHECFEDEQVAAIMNDLFVCIKVDREERPDIDQVYMQALQLMTGQGGWPLNCFALPDGRPIYGGTYFPKKNWINILINLADGFKQDPDKFYEYAEKLTAALQTDDHIYKPKEDPEIPATILTETITRWKQLVDSTEGGPDRAPKFPLPNNYSFLLRYAIMQKDNELLDHVCLTLNKMALGGIYDQVGGGFSRYSTDALWKVPHFEKMLYDNAQLIRLYCETYKATKEELYREVVYETFEFVIRELTDKTGMFYSALDADSEGEEGKFYVWKKEELQTLLGSRYALFADYYNVNELGHWEHGNHILLRTETDGSFAGKNNLTLADLKKQIQEIKQLLLIERNKRTRPGLDDKSLTSWNGLMITACAEAFRTFNDERFFVAGKKAMDFILNNMQNSDGGLLHNYKNGKSTINGFLEDYCFIIEALIGLYQCKFESNHIKQAIHLTNYCFSHFQNKANSLFYFTSNTDEALVARKTEMNDNVIPASNSCMAHNLFCLGHITGNLEWIEQSKKMLLMITDQMMGYGSAYSNWALLTMNFIYPFYEVCIVGNRVNEKAAEFNTHYIPNSIFAGSSSDDFKLNEQQIALLKGRNSSTATKIYVCKDHTCGLPLDHVSDAINEMK